MTKFYLLYLCRIYVSIELYRIYEGSGVYRGFHELTVDMTLVYIFG